MLVMGLGEQGTSSESEWEEEETTSSDDEVVVDEDFGLPEMVIFVHEPIYRVCKEVGMDARCLMKCVSECDNLSDECGCDELVSDACGEECEESCESGIVSYDEQMNVYKKVILVRDVEEVIRRSHGPKSDQGETRDRAETGLLAEELNKYEDKESFYFDAHHEKGSDEWNCNPPYNVHDHKLKSLGELMSMTRQVDNATKAALSPPPVAYSVQKSETITDLGKSFGGRNSFSFPILAKEWFGSPVRMAESSNKFSLQGLLRYFRCCSF